MTADPPPEIICISDDDDNDKDRLVPADSGQEAAKPEFPKRLGSFLTRGVTITSCSPKSIAAGAQLIFPLKAKKATQKMKKRKIAVDEGSIRFLISESAEPYKGQYPPPLGHYDRNRLEIAKLDFSISKILMPLLTNHYIALSGVIIHSPSDVGLSTPLDIELHVFVLPKLFLSTSKIDDVSGELQYDPEAHIRSQFFNLLQLIGGVSVESLYQVSKNESASAKFRLEALYESVEVEHQQLPEASVSSRLKCTLRPYQKQALYWLLCREKSIVEKFQDSSDRIDPQWQKHRFPDSPTFFYSNRSTLSFSLDVPYVRPKLCGGILGDEMGMGKTVEMIALMASGTPDYEVDDELDYIKATLVVCPMSLLSQWESEVEKHSDLTVASYYGTDREMPDKFDVLVTTYGTLSSEFKNADSSPLLKPIWDRVVLDEAHHIKNKTTLIAKAAFALNARARFAVTGTPIQNNLGDLFSLFFFLREEPWSKYSWWRSQIETPYEQNNPIALQRLKTILHPLFLRRCKTSKDINGKPLLNLPPRDEQIVHITLSVEERALYDAFFNQTQTEVNGLLESGAFSKNVTNVLEMILRLRQCCCHPLLVLGYTPDGGAKQYADAVSRLVRNLRSKTVISDDGSDPSPSQYVENLTSELKSSQTGPNLECPICLDDDGPTDPVFTHCGHVMCRECSSVLFSKKKLVPCPICRYPIKRHQLLNGFSTGSSAIDLNKEWRHSSKTKRLLSEIDELHSADCESRTVIFSQWSSMLDLAEKALSEKNHLYLRLDGSVQQRARERILNQFTSPDSEYRILLCSLKVGGVGLNLVAASNVILLDIWWNPAVDAQAIDRVHRIGQTKTVKVRRFIVSQSIETRILELQMKKSALAHGALQSAEHSELSERQQNIVHLFEAFN